MDRAERAAGSRPGASAEGKRPHMEQNGPELWRVWVDARRRVVSFHPEEGFCLLEFQSRELFLACIDQYTGEQYRYM